MPEDIKLERTTSRTSSNPTDLGTEGHVMQISDMVEAIRNGTKPLVDQHEGRKPVEIIMAIYESSRTGMPVEL